MNAGPSGFHNAPVTKGLIILCGVASVFAATQGRASSLGLSYQAIAKKFHLWKLVTSIFVFSSTSELLFGLTLLYYFRVFERQIGSNKYSVQILSTAVFSTVLELVILLLFKDWFPDGLASGPYSVIVSLFVPFFLDIPVSSRFHLFNVRLSDKSFIYLAGIQLLLSSWKRSFVPGICGVIAGICYRMNICGIQKFKLPKVVTITCSRLFSPFISSGPSNAPPRRSVGRETINAPLGQQFQGHRAQPSSAPSEEAIAMLVSMGFDRASAVQALVQTRNDVNAAADLLLSRQ